MSLNIMYLEKGEQLMIWEYKVFAGLSIGGKPDTDGLEKALNTDGSQEWELVTILPSVDTKAGPQMWRIYKRPMLVRKPKA